MKPQRVTYLYIYPNDDEDHENLLISIMEPGEEYYFHLGIWRDVPFTFRLDAQTSWSDITLKRVVTIRDDGCNSNEDYNYIVS